mgnify:CR=1 FL=1
MKKFPKTIYVNKEKESDDSEYLLAWDSADDANDGLLAIYELKEIKTKSTKTILSLK